MSEKLLRLPWDCSDDVGSSFIIVFRERKDVEVQWFGYPVEGFLLAGLRWDE